MTAPLVPLLDITEFSVNVGGDRAATWKQILGVDEVPVLSPVTSLADVPNLGRCEVYLIDIKALSGEQHARLAMHVAHAFQLPLAEVMDEMLQRSVPILAAGCSVIARSTRWFV